MRSFERLPVAIQTVYAELAGRAWTGSFQEIMQAGGTPHRRTVKGRNYWLLASCDAQWQAATGQISGT